MKKTIQVPVWLLIIIIIACFFVFLFLDVYYDKKCDKSYMDGWDVGYSDGYDKGVQAIFGIENMSDYELSKLSDEISAEQNKRTNED